LFGTHTHVPTADDGVLPRGTGYVTDLGMCGGVDGVMGISSDVILKRYLTGLPEKFTPAEGAIACDGVIFTVDDVSGKTLSTQRVRF
jgi:calcineurin-like phosphoesterase